MPDAVLLGLVTTCELARMRGARAQCEVHGWSIEAWSSDDSPDGFEFEALAPDDECITDLRHVRTKLKAEKQREESAAARAEAARRKPTTARPSKQPAPAPPIRKPKAAPPPKPETARRASSRKRYSPLDFWAGERVVYKGGEGGPQVAGIIAKRPLLSPYAS
jgi:hypothetical protein